MLPAMRAALTILLAAGLHAATATGFDGSSREAPGLGALGDLAALDTVVLASGPAPVASGGLGVALIDGSWLPAAAIAAADAPDHLLVRGFPVQFLVAHGLTEEAVREAERIDYQGVPAKVFRAEHIVAIAASVGRAKGKARIEQMLQQTNLDKTRLESILQRYDLKLPAL